MLIAHRSLLTAQRHEFNPNVVAIAERILITVWMISFQVSLFFIVVNGLRTPSKSPPRGRLITKGRVGILLRLVFFLFTLAVGRWLLAFHFVMLNLFQHLTASLYLPPLLGEILKFAI